MLPGNQAAKLIQRRFSDCQQAGFEVVKTATAANSSRHTRVLL